MIDTNKTEVQIRRKITSSHLPAKIVNDSKVTIGSVLYRRGTLGILDADIEKKLLCRYLGIEEGDRTYPEKKEKFWKEFRVLVPTNGVVLNIAISSVETEKVGKGKDAKEKIVDVFPDNLLDYITYLWLLNHPQVAKTEAQMKADPRKRFYIYDPVAESAKQNVLVQNKKQAYLEFANLKPEKMDILVKLLLGLEPANLTPSEKENALETFVQQSPNEFVKFATDPDLEIRAEIEKMVDAGILRKQGASYLYMDTTVGDSIAEAISYMKNDRNSEVVLDLKSKLKELVV